VPVNSDPANECPGFSCAAYYTGFGPGQDVCYRRQDVSDAAATCNGSGACSTAASLCPAQPAGAVQIDCNNVCQSPQAGTCSGTTAGVCNNLDNPLDLTSCGLGACQKSVQKCTSGQPNTCTPGTPSPETCNNVDDDCNGTPDNGAGSDLCPAAPFAASYACTAGTCSFSCVNGRFDLNQIYADGCECADDSYGNSCSSPTLLPAQSAGSSATYSGVIVPDGESDWFSVSFPNTGRGPAQGAPKVALTGPNASNFQLDFFSNCSTSAYCQSGAPTGIAVWQFIDNQSLGTTAYSGPHTVPWPGTLLFRVHRVVSVATCAAASYTVTVSR
jgi:hypothetical protein